MIKFFANFLDEMLARLTGPMNFRFIVQPLVAIVLGMRDGRLDARAGTPPFIFDLIFKPKDRKRQLKSAFKSLLTPIIIGTILDAIAQYLLFKHVRPLPALFVGICVMGIPYSFARGITNRIVTLKIKKK